MTVPGEGRPADRSLPALAARAQLGDRGALEELLRRLQPPLGAHIRALVRDDDLAADVLQDTLIIVCRRLDSVRNVEWVRAWAYRVATREAFRSLRQAHRERETFVDDLSSVPELSARDEELDDDEMLVELPAKLAALPVAAQVVLRLRYQESLTQQEIAEALEIPIGTVKSRIAYGLMCLRRAVVR